MDEVHQLINPKTGNTYKEDNLKTMHNIPLGTLVECKFDTWHTGGACEKNHVRMWVVQHTRDCDGTPLYSISQWKGVWPEMKEFRGTYHNFPEYMLASIEVTKDLEDGIGALSWGEAINEVAIKLIMGVDIKTGELVEIDPSEDYGDYPLEK